MCHSTVSGVNPGNGKQNFRGKYKKPKSAKAAGKRKPSQVSGDTRIPQDPAPEGEHLPTVEAVENASKGVASSKAKKSRRGKFHAKGKGGRRTGQVALKDELVRALEEVKSTEDALRDVIEESIKPEPVLSVQELLDKEGSGERLSLSEGRRLVTELESEMSVSKVVKKYIRHCDDDSFHPEDKRLDSKYFENFDVDCAGLHVEKTFEYDYVPVERIEHSNHLIFTLFVLSVFSIIIGRLFGFWYFLCVPVLVAATHVILANDDQEERPLIAKVCRLNDKPNPRDMRVESAKVTPAVLDSVMGALMYEYKVPLSHKCSASYWKEDMEYVNQICRYGTLRLCIGYRCEKTGYEYRYSGKVGIATAKEVISYEKFLQLIATRNISPLRSTKLNHDVIRQRAGAMPSINVNRSDVLVHNIEENTILAAVLFSRHLKASRTGSYLVDLLDSDISPLE